MPAILTHTPIILLSLILGPVVMVGGWLCFVNEESEVRVVKALVQGHMATD